MKAICTLTVIAGLIVCLSACKKDGNNANQALIGKWYENKLSITQQTISTGAILDTTYLINGFSRQDYIQFNTDGTGVISLDGSDYSVYGIVTPAVLTLGGDKYHFQSYNVKGSLVILQSAQFPYNESTLQLQANNSVLQLSLTFTGGTYKTTTVAYYTMGN